MYVGSLLLLLLLLIALVVADFFGSLEGIWARRRSDSLQQDDAQRQFKGEMARSLSIADQHLSIGS